MNNKKILSDILHRAMGDKIEVSSAVLARLIASEHAVFWIKEELPELKNALTELESKQLCKYCTDRALLGDTISTFEQAMQTVVEQTDKMFLGGQDDD